MSFLYNVVAHIAALFLIPVVIWRILFSDGRYAGCLGIFRYDSGHRGSGRCIWIHASSAGEVRAAAELIHRIRELGPGIRIVLTVFTSRGMKVAGATFAPDIDIHYLPFDIPIIIQRAYKAFDPAMIVITETELWPNLMREAFRRRLPVAIVNGRLSDVGIRRYLALKSLFGPLIRRVAYIHTQSVLDAERFLLLGAAEDSVRAGENLKIAGMLSSLSRFDRRSVLDDLGLTEEHKIVVCGSTREGEERVILDAFGEVRLIHPEIRLLLAPRHTSRVGETERLIAQRGYSCRRRSEMSGSESPDWDVLILDTMGELWRMYGIGVCAFVGGSLVPIGGHNPLEPIALGVPTCFGPHMHNARELAETCVREGIARIVHSSSDLARFIGLCTDGSIPRPAAGRVASLFGSDVDVVADRVLSMWNRANV